MKVVIAGSRAFYDYTKLKKVCDHLLQNFKKEDLEIVSGGARGADKLGETYAKERGISLSVFPADWDKYGKRAGFIRNEQMAKYGDILIAFWDGKSSGTKNMILLGRKYKMIVKICKYLEE